MKSIRLSYPLLYNAGDLLNVDLVERISGRKVERSKVYNADMMAIGGALFGAQYSDGMSRRICQGLLKLVYGRKPLYVWGSGFLYNTNENNLYRTNLKVCALRGAKSQEKLSRLTGRTYDVPLADAGLLVDMFLDEMPDKKYDIGLIPHFSQQNDAIIKKMCAAPGVHLIDIKRTPAEVVKDIAACRSIASSSLHGLIFADALHIPSLHILGETALPGGNFKFEDYYSSYGLEDKPWNIEMACPSMNDIISLYRIDSKVVEEKKKALIECFPAALKGY